jgi:[FeFe] hydrogenase H-cluster maturation GTPase HydF
MSLNETPSGERTHIGFFGARNAGKSSLVNAVTGQELAVVSDVKGTTTDPVRKAMELLPLGPVVIIDTPGFDDEGALGLERVKKTREILRTCDVAVLVVDAAVGMGEAEAQLLDLFRERELPFLIAWNKSDLAQALPMPEGAAEGSSLRHTGIEALKERLAHMAPVRAERKRAGDLAEPGDICVLVCPMDESAPKGRLILPQQQTIRDLLDRGAIPCVCRDTELETALKKLGKPPAMVITDSQAFRAVSAVVPESVPLTSFSILMARYKGYLETAVEGIAAVKSLGDGDRVLMAEGCTHHRQCNDIGTVKIPGWVRKASGTEDLEFSFTSGGEFPDELSEYALVVHCGGCMLNETEMKSRLARAAAAGVPVVNYGIAIAQMHGILARSLEPFPELLRLLDE